MFLNPYNAIVVYCLTKIHDTQRMEKSISVPSMPLFFLSVEFLGEVFPDYPKPDRPADFVIKKDGVILAVGFARYDSDRGGAQEDDRTGGYHNASSELLEYAKGKDLRTKVIFVNDGPGLLLGSMWNDYSYLEEVSDDIKVVTLRMIVDRINEEWLNS